MRRGTLALLWLLTSLAPLAIRADDYHLYAMWRPPELNPVGVNGYVDLEGRLGLAGEEYLFFLSPDWETGGAAAFVYRVETEGDPHQHPDNLEAPGPVTARTFTRVSSYTITELGPDWFPSADGGLYVDGSGIYYGALLHGVYHWDFDWTPLGHEVAAGLFAGSGETFAANPRVAGQWWAGIWGR